MGPGGEGLQCFTLHQQPWMWAHVVVRDEKQHFEINLAGQETKRCRYAMRGMKSTTFDREKYTKGWPTMPHTDDTR